jgi:hypothetical protein
MPKLSISVRFNKPSLDRAIITVSYSDLPSASLPDFHRYDSAVGEAHGPLTKLIGLEKAVSSIQEKQSADLLSTLPPQHAAHVVKQQNPAEICTPRPASSSTTPRLTPESSTSAVVITHDDRLRNRSFGSEASTSTDMSNHSVVRGHSSVSTWSTRFTLGGSFEEGASNSL